MVSKFKSSKVFLIIVSSLLIISLLTACSSQAASSSGSSDSSQGQGQKKTEKIIVKDMAGNDVSIASNPQRIAITSWGEPFGILVSLGQIDRIAAMSDTSMYAWLRKVDPQLLKVPDYGSFEDVNTEELLKLNADIIMTPATAPKSNEKMRQLGMPVYVTKVEDTYEYYVKELRAIAALVGESEKAEKLLKYNNDLVALVKERVKNIPQNQRKRVYIMRQDILQKHNNDWESGQTVVNAGGINVAGNTDKGFTTNPEALLAWDPEYIFQVKHVDNNDDYYNVLRNDQRYANITAVKNGDVYQWPVGTNYWYGSAEVGLGTLLIAKTLYPDLFKDLNMKDETKKFYKTFLNLDLSDASYEDLLHGFNGAKSLMDK